MHKKRAYNVCLLSTFSELQYLVAEGASAPEAKDIAVRENVDSKYIVILLKYQ